MHSNGRLCNGDRSFLTRRCRFLRRKRASATFVMQRQGIAGMRPTDNSRAEFTTDLCSSLAGAHDYERSTTVATPYSRGDETSCTPWQATTSSCSRHNSREEEIVMHYMSPATTEAGDAAVIYRSITHCLVQGDQDTNSGSREPYCSHVSCSECNSDWLHLPSSLQRMHTCIELRGS